MRRVMIIGAVGTGKSTLGTQLGHLLGLPVIHLDLIVWQPGCRVIADDDFMAIHREILAGDSWLIEGVGHWESWGERAAAADTIVLPDYGPWQAWRWVLKRQTSVLLRHLPAAPPDCPVLPMTIKLLRWVWIYRREMRPAIEALVEAQRAQGTTVLRFQTPEMMRRCLRELELPDRARD
jgi:adenylate kinase family enzyme